MKKNNFLYMPSFVQVKYQNIGTFIVFSGNYSTVIFSIKPSTNSVFTLLTAIDPASTLVEDPVYNNYTGMAQDIIYYPGKFAIKVINPGIDGINLEYKIM